MMIIRRKCGYYSKVCFILLFYQEIFKGLGKLIMVYFNYQSW